MKNPSKKLAALILLSAAYSVCAMADDLGGALTADPTATDYYQIICDSETEHVYFELTAGIPKNGPIVSAQLFKDNQVMSITDPVTGDTGKSRPVKLLGGPGTYGLIINKSQPGKVAYTLLYHCENANNQHTVTDYKTLQDDVPK